MILIYLLLICLVAYASPILGTLFFYVDSRFWDDLDKAMELRRSKRLTSRAPAAYTPTILIHRRPRRLPLAA